MQKIFIKYLSLVMAAAIISMITVSYILQNHNAQNRMKENSILKLNQIALTIENNKKSLTELNEMLDNNYITKAKTFAYIIEKNPSILQSSKELQNIKNLLSVDELHVINKDGILEYSTIVSYVGMDFRSTKQTEEFLKLIDNPTITFAQEVQPNGIEKKLFKYVGAGRRDAPGFVQVGISPKRQLEAMKQNELQYIFSHLPVEIESSLFAVDTKTGVIVAHSEKKYLGNTMFNLGFPVDYTRTLEKGCFFTIEGNIKKYYFIKQYDNLLLGIGQKENALYRERFKQISIVIIFFTFIFFIVIFMINLLLKTQIINGINKIISSLEEITAGNLNTEVNIEGNREFKKLSSEINKMVSRILEANTKVINILNSVDFPIGVFEYKHGVSNDLFITEKLPSILSFSKEEIQEFNSDKTIFLKKINLLMEKPYEGNHIYLINSNPQKWVRINIILNSNSLFGIVSDVTEEILDKRKIQYERDHDPLTKLMNHKCFSEMVKNIIKNRPLITAAMLMIDLDNFKDVNDTYGHDYGDTYLKETAYFLSKLCEKKGIVARRSGDEFCIFIYSISSKDEVKKILENFYIYLKENKIYFPDGSSRVISMSIGLSWYNKNSTFESMLREADEALYISKNNNKGYFEEK